MHRAASLRLISRSMATVKSVGSALVPRIFGQDNYGEAFIWASAKPEERQDGDHDDDEANDVDNSVHNILSQDCSSFNRYPERAWIKKVPSSELQADVEYRHQT